MVFSGNGSAVTDLALPLDGPLVATGSYTGTDNFIVKLVAPTDTFGTLLFNEIGTYSGDDLEPEMKAGSYKLTVENASGPWTVTLRQPTPTDSATVLPATIQGQGSKVIPIRVPAALQPTVTGIFQGDGNFIVKLVGYGDSKGFSNLLFNEIGAYQGQKLVTGLQARSYYLLSVYSNGNRSLNFSP